MAGLFEKSSLSSPWKELFADIVKLDEFTQQSRKVHVHNALIENYDISNANLQDAVFEKTEWKNVIAKKIVTSKAVFKDSKFEKVSFAGANFSEVLFENSEFIDVEFDEAQLSDVRFVNCKFKGTDFWKLQHSKIKFDHARIEKSQFSDSSAELAFFNSILNDVDMRSLQDTSSLTFEKSELKEVNTDRSALTLLRVANSRIDATFKNAKIDRMEFENSELDTSLSESEITSLLVASSKIKTLRMNSVKMDSVVIRECEHTKNFGFYKATVRKIDIEKSRLSDFDMAKTSVETLRINDSTLSNSDFEELKVKSATLEKVTLDGKVDFTNARIDQFVAKNITKLPSLNLITTGSNVKFD